EEPVPDRQAAEVDREDARDRLAVGAEQRQEIALPGDLVDEAAEAGERRQPERDRAEQAGPASAVAPGLSGDSRGRRPGSAPGSRAAPRSRAGPRGGRGGTVP